MVCILYDIMIKNILLPKVLLQRGRRSVIILGRVMIALGRN